MVQRLLLVDNGVSSTHLHAALGDDAEGGPSGQEADGAVSSGASTGMKLSQQEAQSLEQRRISLLQEIDNTSSIINLC